MKYWKERFNEGYRHRVNDVPSDFESVPLALQTDWDLVTAEEIGDHHTACDRIEFFLHRWPVPSFEPESFYIALRAKVRAQHKLRFGKAETKYNGIGDVRCWEGHFFSDLNQALKEEKMSDIESKYIKNIIKTVSAFIDGS